MKKTLLAILLLLCSGNLVCAQITCNSAGTLILFTNYDGGVLNINVDVNIPNLKIGICSYEAVTVNLSGTYLSNVTGIRYAGYNSANNNHCGTPVIATTTINGAPASVTPVITYAPSSPVSNSNGYPSIICGYGCSTTTNQGGCNTIDQIEAYFLNQFAGSTVRMHKVQYGCWTGTYAVSVGGTCCLSTTPPPPTTPLSGTVSATSANCYGACNGSVSVTASGGTAPYTYHWTGGPNTASWAARCAGTYTVTITDAASNTTTQNVTVGQPAPIGSSVTRSSCGSYTFNNHTRTSSGVYKDTLLAANGCDSVITTNLTITSPNMMVTQSGGKLISAATSASYQWYSCDKSAIISGATNQSYTPVAIGYYAVIVTRNGCTDTSDCVSVSSVGIPGIEETAGFRLYPNPAHDVLSVELSANAARVAYYITDGTGRVVLTGRTNGAKTRISISSLQPGIYRLELHGVTGGQSFSKY